MIYQAAAILTKNFQTILDFHSRRYYVKTISYNEHSIHVIDINFSNGSCILPSGSVKTVKEFSRDSHYKGRLSYTSFAHCSTEINQIPYRPVPCFPRNGSNFVYAIYEGYLLMPDLEPSCSLISVAPEDFVDVKFPSYEATMKILQAGFHLGWSAEHKTLDDSRLCISLTQFTITSSGVK